MTRQFRVGDIVDAKDVDAEKVKAPISEVTPGGSLFCVGGHYFFDHELTLVAPVENNRGVEQYKDQFTPWRDGHMVGRFDSKAGDLSEKEEVVGAKSNAAIKQMMEQ